MTKVTTRPKLQKVALLLLQAVSPILAEGLQLVDLALNSCNNITEAANWDIRYNVRGQIKSDQCGL